MVAYCESEMIYENPGGWSDGTAVKSTGSSPRGPRLSPWSPWRGSQLPVTAAAGHLTATTGLCGHGTQEVHT